MCNPDFQGLCGFVDLLGTPQNLSSFSQHVSVLSGAENPTNAVMAECTLFRRTITDFI